MLTSQVQGRKVWKRQRNPVKREETFLFYFILDKALGQDETSLHTSCFNHLENLLMLGI